jgi:predicted PurR-regulated permease PerM
MPNLDKPKTVNVTFTNRTIVRIVIFVAVGLTVLNFISSITYALQLIFFAFFLALALNPAVSWISYRLKSKSRPRATAVAYMIVLLILAGFLGLIVPPFVNQTVDLVKEIPTSVSDIQDQDTPLVRFIRENDLTDEYTKVVSDIRDNLQNITSRVFSTITAVGSGVVALITVLVMTFMMLIEGPRWIEKYMAMQPKNKIDKRKRVLLSMYRMVTGYVNGQLFIATVAALFAMVALLISSTILGVSINAVALASIVGLIGLIPMIGNTIAAIIVIIFCLFVSLPLAIIMAVFFLVYQQVENATLQPYIQSKYNELTPLTVFVAALLGVSIAGFLGALVAIPVAGCLRIILVEYYSDKFAPKKLDKTA